MATLDITLGVVGVGNMGQALLRGAVTAGVVAADRVLVSDTRAEVATAVADELGLRVAEDNAELVRQSDVILLCVKPQVFVAVLAAVSDQLDGEKTLISVAAGLTLETLEATVGAGVPVIRTMPNTPCLVGAGASAYSLGSAATTRHGDYAAALLGAVGLVVEVPEDRINAVTATSGSGPAYVFRLIEAMTAGAVEVGLDRTLGARLALQTVLGAARLADETGVDPAELRRRVTSPGGTTQAAIGHLDRNGFEGLIKDAMVVCRDRGIELGKAPRPNDPLGEN